MENDELKKWRWDYYSHYLHFSMLHNIISLFFLLAFFFTSCSIFSNCLISACLTVIGSFLNNFPIEKMSKISNKVNGSAETREADCNASRPPAYSRTAAIADIRKPQIILTIRGGNKLPFVVILANMYVAESAEVIKNVKMRTMNRKETTPVNGKV